MNMTSSTLLLFYSFLTLIHLDCMLLYNVYLQLGGNLVELWNS